MRSTPVCLLFGAIVVSMACGGHSASPAAPSTSATAASAAPAPGSAVVAGATISGTVVGAGGASRIKTLATGLTVSVTGTSVASPVDGSGRFMLQNVPAGRVELHFTGTGIDAKLELEDVAEHATVVVSVRVSGTTAELDNEASETDKNEAEVEGLVTAINGSALTVAGKSIMVTTTTTIVHGGTALKLSNIHVGDRVHVKGTASGTSITATQIEVQQGQDTPGSGDDHGGSGSGTGTGTGTGTGSGGDDHGGDNNGGSHGGAEVDLSGTISGKSGTCPSLTFTVAATKIVTSGSTEFKDTTCAALANGASVEVKGTKQSGGTVAATRVEKK